MRRAAVAGLAAVIALCATSGAAVGATATALDARAAIAGAQVAVDAGGAVGVVYPYQGSVRLWLSTDRTGTPLPLARRVVVLGLVLSPTSGPMVLTRQGVACSDLSLMSKVSGAWVTESLGGRARSAAITSDASGQPVVVSQGCDGAVEVRTRSAQGRWVVEPTSIVGRTGHVSLVAAAGGLMVVGLSGRDAAIAVRSTAGAWSQVALPEGPLVSGESVSTLSVALDPQARPVAFLVRGPNQRPSSRVRNPPQVVRLVSRLDGLTWQEIATSLEPIGLAGSGLAFALVDRSGSTFVESPAVSGAAQGRAIRVAIGSSGILARIPSAGVSPQVLVGL